MAKVSIKSEKIIVFGGIFFVLDRFDRDSRCPHGYQSELFILLTSISSLATPASS